jgi:hypothetical protein
MSISSVLTLMLFWLSLEKQGQNYQNLNFLEQQRYMISTATSKGRMIFTDTPRQRLSPRILRSACVIEDIGRLHDVCDITLTVVLPEATMNSGDNGKISLQIITRVRRMNKSSVVSSRHTSHFIAHLPSLPVLQQTEPPRPSHTYTSMMLLLC